MKIIGYPIWHYLKAPLDILKIWLGFLKFFFFYFFAVPELAKTFFKPWKRDITVYSGRGFDLGLFAQTIAFNLISRSIGFAVRTVIIAAATIVEIILLALGPIFLIFWLAWPLLFAYSVIFSNLPFLALCALSGILFFWFYKNAKEKPADEMGLKEIFKQKWKNAIWERIDLNPKEISKEVLKNPKENLQAFLEQKGIKREDFEIALFWEISRQKKDYLKKRWWRKEKLFSVKSPFEDLSYGYTPLIDQYAEPVNALGNYEDSIGHGNELEMMERILSKSKQSNALIIGEPGVGKMSMVRKFARMAASGKSMDNLNYRRVVLLDMNAALAGITAEGELEARLIKIFNQASTAGNLILVINDFQNFVNIYEIGAVGKKDISQIIMPFLEGGYFQLIAITTYRGLHEQIEKNGGLMKIFEKVEVKEPDKETTLKICRDCVWEVEARTAVKFTVQAIKEIVERADLYITDTPFPEKALDLLEETAIYVASRTQDYLVEPRHVDLVISQKTEIPVGQIEESEKEKLLNLENILHQRIVNQKTAVDDIASAMRRSRLEVGEKKRPIGSFLFLGPTGVGKTETAKTLAEAYFGSEEKMNRFDMSEFQGVGAVQKMIGSRQKGTSGVLTTAVKENPFSLLLLDEIEKADYAVLNLFLQVLDEGWLTDARGRKINFRNQIIIATSNAGAEFIRTKIKEGGGNDEKLRLELLDQILKKGVFRPEFLNRFDETIIFKPLTREHLLKIAELMLNGLKRRLAKQDIIFDFDSGLAAKIVELGYDPANGARPMRRVIQKKVEDLIAKKLLKDEIKKETPFTITAADI